jgi:hypothetical protein
MRKKSEHVTIEWWCHEKLTRKSVPDTGVVRRRKLTDMCTIERFATILFVSEHPLIAKVPKITEISPTVKSDSSCRTGKERKTRYATTENLRAKPASTTEPGQDAST